ncbi:hypothetical protein QR77_35550 [Streptomyces sp. 150FB]|nr:hypothetical protein QR77_35550 [Streptomyces sp. 150FB]
MPEPSTSVPSTSAAPAAPTSDTGRSDLRADCGSCFGLCCVALTFSVSADFPVDKGAGEPCSHLQEDFRCGVHTDLRQRGFRGCTVYDCFGAGQKISQITFAGQDWRQEPRSAERMFAVLPVMRQLQELLWYLNEALERTPEPALHEEIKASLAETERLTLGGPAALLDLDVAAHRATVNPLLLHTSELIRAGTGGGKKKNRRGADLFGAKLRGADLRGADLRGAYLIAADLRGADLRLADLIGADCRDTDLRGADLTGSIFLTQTQVNAAKGDSTTKLPPSLARPAHW